MDTTMPTLAQREALLNKLPPRPEHLPLSVLISAVIRLDPSYQGVSEKEFFVLAYGDKETGRREYRNATERGADDPCVRSYAVMRLARLQKQALKEAASA